MRGPAVTFLKACGIARRAGGLTRLREIGNPHQGATKQPKCELPIWLLVQGNRH